MSQNCHPGNLLPRAEDAQIDIRKFEQYSMDPNNRKNGGKWTAFAAIGYDVQSLLGRRAGAQDVINQLRAKLGSAPATKGEASIYGDRFEVKLEIKGPSGKEGILYSQRDRFALFAAIEYVRSEGGLGEITDTPHPIPPKQSPTQYDCGRLLALRSLLRGTKQSAAARSGGSYS